MEWINITNEKPPEKTALFWRVKEITSAFEIKHIATFTDHKLANGESNWYLSPCADDPYIYECFIETAYWLKED